MKMNKILAILSKLLQQQQQQHHKKNPEVFFTKQSVDLGIGTQLPPPPKFDFFKMVDEGFIATWDKDSGKKIATMTEFFRKGVLNERFAHEYFKTMEIVIKREWNDHHLHPNNITTSSLQTEHLTQMPPIDVGYRYDGVTDYGLSLFCGLIVGKSLPHISHMAAGDGIGETVDYQDTLVSERIKHAFAEKGYMNSLNRDLRFTMTFDITLPTFTVREIGLFNNGSDNTGPLVSRTSFDPGIVHTSGQNYVTANYLISTLSSS